MSDVFVIGVGCTPFGRHIETPIRDLARYAIRAAMADADIDTRAVGAAFFANSSQAHFDGQHALRGPIALRHAGFENLFVTSVENACAGGLTAFSLAVQAIRAGACEVAIAVGAEKLVDADKSKSFSAFDSGVDLGDPDGLSDGLRQLTGGLPAADDGALKRSRMMDIYAALAAFHMRNFGSTARDFAYVASKNRNIGARNPLAAIRSPIGLEEVLASRPVVGPLTVPMCAPLTDGAAAVLLASSDFAQRIAGRVRVRAAQVLTGANRQAEALDKHVARRTSQAAYEEAGLGPNDIDIAEVHDATAVGEVLQSELLGFCEIGAGARLASSGATSLGGARPINLSGGLESKGHPLGATGLSQICELTWQLRGHAGDRQAPGARIALAENGGGFLTVEEAVCGVAILEAVA
ncbi:MAG: acetyl-CoA acetyltransferase [Caulobacteraceae bacterium]|nr:MAG: acetyl-CoA acetyltransferase [Caulobacteraceae bacterium]